MPMSFIEAVVIERGWDPLPADHDLPTARIRRKLLHGQAMHAMHGEEEGGSKALVSQTVKLMGQWGYTIKRERREDGVWMSLENREYVPTEADRPAPARRRRNNQPLPEGVSYSPSSTRGQIARRLLDGEVLTSAQVRDEYKCDQTNLGKVASELEQLGYIVERTGSPQKVTVTGQGEPPQSKAVEKARTVRRRQEEELNRLEEEAELEPVPQLDQNLKVYLTYRDPDTQQVKVGIRNGTRSWLCTVDGHVDSASFV